MAVSMLGQRVEFHCIYFYCKTCHAGDSPMRRWLGIHDGEVSLGVERAVAHLTMKETFGEAASQLEEQHGQEFDRTKLERITYRVGAEAERYLELRRRGMRQYSPARSRIPADSTKPSRISAPGSAWVGRTVT